MDIEAVAHETSLGRFYTFNGYVMPSVTTVIGAYGEYAGQEMTDKREENLEKAAEKGERLHLKLQAFLTGSEVSADNEEDLGALSALNEEVIRLIRTDGVTADDVQVEEIIFEGDYFVAGRYDAWLKDTMFEFKKGVIRQDHRIQAAAYLMSFSGDATRIILVSGAAGSVETIEYGSPEHKSLYSEFMNRYTRFTQTNAFLIAELFPTKNLIQPD